MAITAVNQAGVFENTSASPVTISAFPIDNVVGNNRLLLVAMSCVGSGGSPPFPNSVTIDGASMTYLNSVNNGNEWLFVYYTLDANLPASTGTYDVVWTWITPPNQDQQLVASSWIDAPQQVPPSVTFEGGHQTPQGGSITPTDIDGIITDFMYGQAGGADKEFTAVAPHVELYEIQNMATGSQDVISLTSTSVEWTMDDEKTWAQVIIELGDGGSGGSPLPPPDPPTTSDFKTSNLAILDPNTITDPLVQSIAKGRSITCAGSTTDDYYYALSYGPIIPDKYYIEGFHNGSGTVGTEIHGFGISYDENTSDLLNTISVTSDGRINWPNNTETNQTLWEDASEVQGIAVDLNQGKFWVVDKNDLWYGWSSDVGSPEISRIGVSHKSDEWNEDANDPVCALIDAITIKYQFWFNVDSFHNAPTVEPGYTLYEVTVSAGSSREDIAIIFSGVIDSLPVFTDVSIPDHGPGKNESFYYTNVANGNAVNAWFIETGARNSNALDLDEHVDGTLVGGIPEIHSIQCNAANSNLNNKSFIVYTPAQKYQVWYNWQTTGTPPTPEPSAVLVEVHINNTGDRNCERATADALETITQEMFQINETTHPLLMSNADGGNVTDIANLDIPGGQFTFAVDTQGSDPPGVPEYTQVSRTTVEAGNVGISFPPSWANNCKLLTMQSPSTSAPSPTSTLTVNVGQRTFNHQPPNGFQTQLIVKNIDLDDIYEGRDWVTPDTNINFSHGPKSSTPQNWVSGDLLNDTIHRIKIVNGIWFAFGYSVIWRSYDGISWVSVAVYPGTNVQWTDAVLFLGQLFCIGHSGTTLWHGWSSDGGASWGSFVSRGTSYSSYTASGRPPGALAVNDAGTCVAYDEIGWYLFTQDGSAYSVDGVNWDSVITSALSTLLDGHEQWIKFSKGEWLCGGGANEPGAYIVAHADDDSLNTQWQDRATLFVSPVDWTGFDGWVAGPNNSGTEGVHLVNLNENGGPAGRFCVKTYNNFISFEILTEFPPTMQNGLSTPLWRNTWQHWNGNFWLANDTGDSIAVNYSPNFSDGEDWDTTILSEPNFELYDPMISDGNIVVKYDASEQRMYYSGLNLSGDLAYRYKSTAQYGLGAEADTNYQSGGSALTYNISRKFASKNTAAQRANYTGSPGPNNIIKIIANPDDADEMVSVMDGPYVLHTTDAGINWERHDIVSANFTAGATGGWDASPYHAGSGNFHVVDESTTAPRLIQITGFSPFSYNVIDIGIRGLD